MTATYTYDVFSSLDGYGGYDEPGDWGGYWGKQGPELLEHRAALFTPEQRVVLGARTYRAFVGMLAEAQGVPGADVNDRWVGLMVGQPVTVVSTTLEEPLAWPGATLATGDAVDVVARLKEESDVPLCSHGSLALNRALLAAGLVDRLRLTVFPVLTGRSGTLPLFAGAEDFDLELLESRTLDGRALELGYRPTRH